MSGLDNDSCPCKELQQFYAESRHDIITHNWQLEGLSDTLDSAPIAGFDLEMVPDWGKKITVIQICFIENDHLVLKVIDMFSLDREKVFNELYNFLTCEDTIKVGADIRQDALAIYGNTGIKMKSILNLAPLSFMFPHHSSCSYMHSHGWKNEVSLNTMSCRFIHRPDRSSEKSEMSKTFTGEMPLRRSQIEYATKDAADPILVYLALVGGMPRYMERVASLDHSFDFIVDGAAVERRSTFLSLYPYAVPDHEEDSEKWMRKTVASTDIENARKMAIAYIIEHDVRQSFALSDDDVVFVKKEMSGNLKEKEFSPLVYEFTNQTNTFLETRKLCLMRLRAVISQPNLSFYSDHLGDVVVKCLRMKEVEKGFEGESSDEGHD